MSLKRECNRCRHLTLVDSLNDKDFRAVQIHRGPATTTTSKTYDLCKDCIFALEDWLEP